MEILSSKVKNYRAGFTPLQENGAAPRAFCLKIKPITTNLKYLLILCFSKRRNKNASPFFCTGFTLVEVLVYVAVVGLLVITISNLILGMSANYRTTKVKDELALTAQDIFETFFKETKNAKKVYLPTSVWDDDLGKLVLESTFQLGSDADPSSQVKLYISDGRIWLKRETETDLALTPDTIEVTKFRFERIVPTVGREGVRFYLGLKSKEMPGEVFNLTTFAMVRGGYLQ